MEISLDELVERGKASMEMTCETGQFFFPKLAIGRNEKVEVGQYDSELGALQTMLQVISLGGPIDWIAHTSDTYELVDAGLTEAMLFEAGAMSIGDLFEAGDERVTEAMAIASMTRFGFADSVTVPYKRLDGRKLLWGEPIHMDAGSAGGNLIDLMRDAIARSLV